MNSRDAPSHILLVLISHLSSSFPLTNDLLYEEFNPHGDVVRILIFERGNINKAFIEFSSVTHATKARQAMTGHWLSDES